MRGPVGVLAALLAGVLIAAVAPVRAGDSPHQMTKSDGSLNMEICPLCHTPDMGLARSEIETCTLCHAEASHGGSLEHVNAPAAKVGAVMESRPKDAVALPLTKEGRIYCGTCHLYHDPAVLGEAWLATGWVPPDSGLPGAVRTGVVERWAALEKAYDKGADAGSFASQGTRQLRLPVEGGQLCIQCHGILP